MKKEDDGAKAMKRRAAMVVVDAQSSAIIRVRVIREPKNVRVHFIGLISSDAILPHDSLSS